MDDHEQRAVELEDQSLAETTDAADRPADHSIDRRIVGAHHERVADPHCVDRLPGDARRQRTPIQLDVGKFGHWCDLTDGCALNLYDCRQSMDRLTQPSA